MKRNAALWHPVLVVPVLTVLVLSVATLAEEREGVHPLRDRLGGHSRMITGAVRAAGPLKSQATLPKSLVLTQVDGEILIEASPDAAAPPDGISFTRSFDGESWQVGDRQPTLASASRSLGGYSSSSDLSSVAASSRALDQLVGAARLRGKRMVTPGPGSRVLSGKLTVRRAVDGDSQLDADPVEIVRDNQTIIDFVFPTGQHTLAWQDIPEIPASFRDGLPAGEYSIRIANRENVFTVEEDAFANWVYEPIDRFAELVGNDSLSALIYSVDFLLAQTDERGFPSPYFSDALDRIDAYEPESPYGASRRASILAALGVESQPEVDPSPTGIAPVDKLRKLIRDGNWSGAKEEASQLVTSHDLRTANLAKLYLAVIVGESSTASVYHEDPASDLFEQAIAAIQTSEASLAADRFRAQTAFANHLSSNVQARIYNYAVQSASGVENPLLTSLWQWRRAQEYYALAEQEAVHLSRGDQAASAINRARLYSILGDFVRNLRLQDEYSSRLVAVADKNAKTFAMIAAELADGEPTTRGAALEVLAHIAYRQNAFESAEENVRQALAAYEQSGSLSGIGSCQRTLGLIRSRDINGADEAIRHFKAAHQIGELSRAQIQLSGSGIDRAGFFARHAYANERLIDLLVQQGKMKDALEFAEMAKARSFQDLLAQQNTADGEDVADDIEPYLPTLDETLQSWPEETCGVEFFIGSRYVYVFCILPGGEVTAHQLADAEGDPLAASELVGRVARFLSSMEFRARKMYGEAISGRGFDKTWQDDLHHFYRQLFPEELQAALSVNQHLVVIPHHILHYFPFAALITETDGAERGKLELPQPTFLIERLNDITIAPSLRSYAYLTDSPSMVDLANAVGIADFDNAPRLPGVEKDLHNFEEVFADAVGRVVREKPITGNDVAAILSERGFVLIGTHGHNEADRPLDSFLLCDADGDHDGHLTARELFQTRIDADVVVLSACYSGLADRSPLPGDDLFGLQRAVLQSGAKTIVAGLWDVYDDTAPELIKSTMMHFVAGASITGSLAAAQREFLQARKGAGPGDPWIHPYFWAVYSCSGGGHSVMLSQ